MKKVWKKRTRNRPTPPGAPPKERQEGRLRPYVRSHRPWQAYLEAVSGQDWTPDHVAD